MHRVAGTFTHHIFLSPLCKVIMAVTHHGHALKWASEDLREDKEVRAKQQSSCAHYDLGKERARGGGV